MNKQMKIRIISAIVVVIVVGLMTAFFVYRYSPSKEVMDLKDYYSVSDDSQLVIVLQDAVSAERGLYIDKIPYVSYGVVKELFNKRFYWDSNEQLMIYTTPEKVIKIQPESAKFKVNKGTDERPYNIIVKKEDVVYIAMPFVKEFSNIEYETYELPNRIVVQYKWNEDVLAATVKRDTVVRHEGSIKSPILAEVSVGDELIMVDTNEEVSRGFSKVITKDGIIGYVKTKKLNESSYINKKSGYTEPAYIHITKDYDINMVWHQVTNSVANDNMLSLLNATKGVNTICPTWFSLKDAKGNINSMADENYVNRAHQAGVEVWGLCDDFTGQADGSEVLSKTSSRERLENKLISTAIEYNLDGINIDFEKVQQENAENFVQFIRELSIKCRNNGIVLSIDNYIPAPYREYYNYEEQAIVADYIVIMAYDEHYSGSEEAGSVSSINFVTEAAGIMAEKYDAGRVIMALPFYTRLWKTKGEAAPESEAYGMNNIEQLLSGKGIKASWENESGQNYAEYEEDGVKCQVWLEDEKSMEEKLKAVTAAGIHNVSFWRLGFEKTDIWNVISQYINAK